MSACPNPLHSYPLPEPYLAAHEKAEKRLNTGWDNVKCPDCNKFGWLPPHV